MTWVVLNFEIPWIACFSFSGINLLQAMSKLFVDKPKVEHFFCAHKHRHLMSPESQLVSN